MELDVEVEIEGEEVEGVGDEEEELGAEPEVEEPFGGPELGDDEGLPPEEEDDMLETVEALLAEAGIEVVDDEKLTEDLVKKVAGRVAKRLLKEFG